MKNLARILLISILLFAACNKVPSHVIQPDDMASLMADIHTAEVVVEMNRSGFFDDSMKQVMRQSVYIRHGVTSQQVDSSIAWYGRNIKYYMDVYDKTIEILEHRLIESGNRIAADNALSIAGDSVDVWPNPRFISINDRLPSRLVSFSFDHDPNWEKGDNYTWRAKLFNTESVTEWLIGVEYSNGSVEWISQNQEGDGWRYITLQTDSMRIPTRIFGYFSSINRPGSDLRLDSVELIRKRLNKENYRRTFSTDIDDMYPPVEINDSIDSGKSDNDSIR
ncbi:MAG: DUF4296 domain-containing protein [Muribaculaceae bacterium]|nr:DUF4296 domain-containing protein [Muribaculaceae bacterium]